jgi:Kef-type K+ transport system membrane component KefB
MTASIAIIDVVRVDAPQGAAWELLVVVAIAIVAPMIAERLRVPGLIGLLAGGCLIGPHVLGVTRPDAGPLASLGGIGLLHLMFVAALEIDLSAFRMFRRQALVIAASTFAGPGALGIIVGRALGYSTTTSVLLGASILASFTPITYPLVKRLGLATHRAVCSTVAATVVCDTMSLLVLTVLAGTPTEAGTGIELAGQVVVGLVLLVLWSAVGLRCIAAWYFRTIGQQRTARYAFLLVAMLSSSVLATVVGIEGLVGAFLAGLALNSSVPSSGALMERVDFFGTTVFVPLFLISVGSVIRPSVLVDPATLGRGVLYIAACLGGTLLAGAVCRPLFGYTWAEVALVYSLASPQAAATLAATFVGYEVGLLTLADVNAVMLLIAVSIVVAPMVASRAARHVSRPPDDPSQLGRSVLLHVPAGGVSSHLVDVARRLVAAEGGVVRPTVVVAGDRNAPSEEELSRIDRQVAAAGIDADTDVRHDRSPCDGVIHAAASHQASVIVVPADAGGWLPAPHGSAEHVLVMSASVPVVSVRAGESATSRRVVLALGPSAQDWNDSSIELAAEIAWRCAGRRPLMVLSHRVPLTSRLTALSLEVAVNWIEVDPVDWLRSECRRDDLVVVSGGRCGALSTARTARVAVAAGATVVSVADRASVLPDHRPGRTVLPIELLAMDVAPPSLRATSTAG